MGGEKRAGEHQRMEVAGFDVGENGKAAIDVRIPQREMAGAKLIGQERDGRKLDAPEIPREDVLGTEQRPVKKEATSASRAR